MRPEPALAVLVLVLGLAGCAADAPGRPCVAQVGGDVAYVVDHGWHTEIGVPADELTGPMAAFRDVYPGARAIMFGYGKRTFMMAPVQSFSELVLGPVPGPAAIETVGLSVAPDAAYGAARTAVVALPPGGARALSDWLWSAFARDARGGPRLIGPADFPGALFYDARQTYTLAHTCNTWIAEALHAAGAPVGAGGVVFAGQVMGRARTAAAETCPLDRVAARP